MFQGHLGHVHRNENMAESIGAESTGAAEKCPNSQKYHFVPASTKIIIWSQKMLMIMHIRKKLRILITKVVKIASTRSVCVFATKNSPKYVRSPRWGSLRHSFNLPIVGKGAGHSLPVPNSSTTSAFRFSAPRHAAPAVVVIITRW